MANCPSVCLTVQKIISKLVSSLQTPTSRVYSKGSTRNFGQNKGRYGKVAFGVQKLISPRGGKIALRLLLIPIGILLHAFDWCQNQRPWMTSKTSFKVIDTVNATKMTKCVRDHCSIVIE